MLPPGVRAVGIREVFADEASTGFVLYLALNDGGGAALFLDREEIEERAYQFENGTHAPEGASLQ